MNALSELDSPGEWYLDRARGVALLLPPSDPTKAVIEFSRLPAPLLVTKDVSHVRFEGITWELGSADGILIEGGEQCLLAGCVVRHFAGNGVELRGGRSHGLLSCDIYSMGRSGVVIAAGDRATLEPGGAFVENCDIHDLSRIDHTYTPALRVRGAGNRVAHNRLHDMPSSAIRIDGDDMIVEYNEIYNVVTESDDQGGADMFGDPTHQGNVYRHNYWHDIGNSPGALAECGRNGIRLDDAISGTLIFGNIFERCTAGGFGAVQIHGGTANTIENNLFIDCAAAVSFDPWETQLWRDHVTDRLAGPKAVFAPDLYAQRYPQFTTLLDRSNANRVRRNATLRCDQLLRNPPPPTETADNVILPDRPFSMQTAPAVLSLPGLDPIPVGEIGLHADTWRK